MTAGSLARERLGRPSSQSPDLGKAAIAFADAIYELATSESPIIERWAGARACFDSIEPDTVPEACRASFEALRAAKPTDHVTFIEAVDHLFRVSDGADEAFYFQDSN